MEIVLRLKGFLSQFLNIPDEEWEAFAPIWKLKEFKKSELFDRQGEISSQVGFILKGAVYFNFVSKEGKELINGFHFENDWVASLGSLVSGAPSVHSSMFLEQSELLVANYEDIKKFYDRHMVWERLGRMMLEGAFLGKERREMEFLSLSAQERYDSFKKTDKNNLSRIPKKLIASYLGIDPATLSRLS